MKKVMLSVAAAAILASCAPETGFDLTIDAQSASMSTTSGVRARRSWAVGWFCFMVDS